MNTIQSLKELYVKLGGQLTDTYSGIAGGIPVSDYTVIPDMIEAVSRVSKNVDVSAIPLVIDIIETPHSDGGSITYTYSVLGVEKMSEIVSAFSNNKPIIVRLTRLSVGDISKVDCILDCQPVTFYPYGSTGESVPGFTLKAQIINTATKADISLQPTSEVDDTIAAVVNFSS